jgi:LEA14-like dessication related protein
VNDNDGRQQFTRIINVRLENDMLSVLANPVKENLVISGAITGAATITLYNSEGRVVKVFKTTNSNNVIIPVNGLSQGIYSAEVLMGGNKQTLRFVIIR